MSDQRPRAFIGSSAEGLPLAEAIQVNLDRACQVTIWSQGVFGLGSGTLESLVRKLGGFDFAILVLTPDDLVESRGTKVNTPRDNVLLELGLCIGALGRERTFVVYDRSADLKLPTDMAGVTPADYEPHDDGNLIAALGAPCTIIKDAISKLGLRSSLSGEESDVGVQQQRGHWSAIAGEIEICKRDCQSIRDDVRNPSPQKRLPTRTLEKSTDMLVSLGAMSPEQCRVLAGLLQAIDALNRGLDAVHKRWMETGDLNDPLVAQLHSRNRAYADGILRVHYPPARALIDSKLT